MTRAEIRNEIRINLDELGITFYTDQNINDSIQDAYDHVAVTTGCIEKRATIDIISNLSYYKMTDYIPDWYSAFAGYNEQTKRWLDPVPYDIFDEQRENWELANQSPFSFCPLTHEYLVVFPRLNSNFTNGLTFFYSATADILSDNTTPQIPDQFIHTLEYWATADLLEDAEEFGKAQDIMTDFQDLNTRLRKWVNQRSIPDRIYRLWPLGVA